ncbi:DNA polymerase III subunit gamma and tau [Dactylosporangium sp. NPDC005555]|uniref:DNA polymerase III subunit gamma and tau n=1 Tax=Dactylosporangium sp. NPDC005555 TaxID=3154889 RepID=UPI0033A1CC02
MALALYRKYRPRTFAEVIGQEHVTEPLSQALRSGRLNHAYLFSGPRGCGKTSSARILARSLNCEKGPTPDPCGECDSCRALAPDGSGSIDVIEIDAASHGGVDDARDLRERAFFAPVSSRFKVYVIDEAHMVSSAGFNALLKLVEEPPEYVKFVFATTEPEKVLGTIKSRTHHYPFRLIPPGVLRPYLEQLTTSEGVKVEPAVFPLVVRAGAGSARDSLSVLDQLISGAGPDGVTYQRAVALLGVTDVALIDEMCDSLAADDGRGAYGVIDRVVEAGHDPRRFASDLLERLRDLIILQQVPDAVAKGLLDAPHDQLERMGAQAVHLGQATLSRFADIVHDGLTEMRGTTAPRLLLELITARMLLPGADDAGNALLQRLERMERRLLAGGPIPAPAVGLGAAPAAQPPAAQPLAAQPAAVQPAAVQASGVPASAGDQVDGGQAGQPSAHVAQPPVQEQQGYAAEPPPEPVEQDRPVSPPPAAAPAPPVTAPPAQGVGALDAVAVRRVWTDVLSLVSGKSKKAAAIVREATVQDVEGTTLVLGFKHTAHANMLNASPDVLIAALSELLGGKWQVRCEVGGQPGGGGGGGSRPSPPRPAPSGPGGGSAPAPGPGDGGLRVGPAVPQQSAESWPTPARPAGDPVPVDARAAAMSAASSQPPGPAGAIGSAAAGGPAGTGGPAGAGRPAGAGVGGSAGAGDGWPTPAAVPGGFQPAQASTGTPQAHAAQAAHPPSQPGGDRSRDGLPRDGHSDAGQPNSGSPSGGLPGGGARGGGHSGGHSGGGQDGGGWPTPAVPGGGAGQSDGWPTPAVPGGVIRTPSGGTLADPRGLAGDQTQAGGTQVSEWPVTATPGGSAAGGQTQVATRPGDRQAFSGAGGQGHGGDAQGAGTQGAPGGGPSNAAAAHGSNGARTQGGRQAGGAKPQNGARPRSAIEQAREAASRAANAPRRGTAAAAPVVESAWEGAGADEPPYDPEYDRPVADLRFPGLDPGDELLDDANSVRESSEEAALRLLSEALGAEKIGETTS